MAPRTIDDRHQALFSQFASLAEQHRNAQFQVLSDRRLSDEGRAEQLAAIRQAYGEAAEAAEKQFLDGRAADLAALRSAWESPRRGVDPAAVRRALVEASALDDEGLATFVELATVAGDHVAARAGATVAMRRVQPGLRGELFGPINVVNAYCQRDPEFDAATSAWWSAGGPAAGKMSLRERTAIATARHGVVECGDPRPMTSQPAARIEPMPLNGDAVVNAAKGAVGAA